MTTTAAVITTTATTAVEPTTTEGQLHVNYCTCVHDRATFYM